ncbi:hypothetical protein [Nocardia sp. NPDC127526]|uniref:hypothetical protein n=1 Tax=Nocardia sp. NPDC127526 TaxID=3345393 RepID=UPI003644F499
MRIIRSDDHHDDDDHDHQHKRRRGPSDPNELDEAVAGIPDDQLGDVLGDEASAFLTAATEAVDGPSFLLGQDAPVEQTPSAKPVLRLVTSDEHLDTEAAPAGPAGLRPRLLRAGLGGSLLVIAVVLLAGWGQPGVVALPLTVYGLGWIAYLWWHAALRPPLPQTFITVTTAIGRALAALTCGICRTFSAAIARLDQSRARREARRTARA